MKVSQLKFPEFSGIRCLMMPFIQGDIESVPGEYHAYSDIIQSTFIKKGDIGYLTIDEGLVKQGKSHRCAWAKTSRSLHTEAGMRAGPIYSWGNAGACDHVILEPDVEVLIANNIDDSCALWDTVHEETSIDGDIGHESSMYPYEDAVIMKAGEVHKIGILTPHESLPVKIDVNRQFLRIVSSGVHGREPYFTDNRILKAA